MNTILLKERVARLNHLKEMFYPVPQLWIKEAEEQKKRDSEIALEECNNYLDVVKAWREAMIWTDELDIALSVMLAVTLSTEMPEDQLWVKIISVPSSGKTTLVEAISTAREYVFPKDSITKFYSGYKTKDGSDTSLILKLNKKTLAIKDGDTLLRAAERDVILAQARGVYDTSGRSHYSNETGGDYEGIRFSWILCGTQRLREIDDSDLGERFLDCVITDEINPDMERTIGKMALGRLYKYRAIRAVGSANNTKTKEMRKAMALTGGYVKYLRENMERLLSGVSVSVDDPQSTTINNLGAFVANMRSRPGKKDTDASHRELSTRLVTQLGKLGLCLAATMGHDFLSPEVVRRIKKVAFDTARGRCLDILRYVQKMGVDGAAERAISLSFDLSGERLSTLLRHMCYNKILEKFREGVTQRYRVRDKFRKLYREVHVK